VGTPHLPIDDVVEVAQSRPEDMLWLDETLSRLGSRSPRQTRAVECRVFGGMGIRDAAEALAISTATVKRPGPGCAGRPR
jgi:hypothetical protein